TGWALSLPERRVLPSGKIPKDAKMPDLWLRGDDAVAVLGKVLPGMSGLAGSKEQVRGAVEILETIPEADNIVARHLMYHDGPLKDAAAPIRLALEMAAHEASERHALEGELKLLEREWRKAEE